MAVPYTFAGATSSIPLSQLDANFATTFTLGNTAIQLGNTVTTLNNMTLANVTISSGNVTITNVSVTTANVTTGNVTTLTSTNATLTNMSSGNVTITGGTINGTTLGATTAASANVTTLTTSSTVTLNGGTANGVAYLNGSKVLTTGSALSFTNPSFFVTRFNVGSLVGTANYRGGIEVEEDNASFRLYGPSDYKILETDGYSAPTNIKFYASNAEQMRLTSTGLGIGTSSPAAKLHVNGDIRIADTSSLLMGIGAEQKIFVAGGANSTYLTFNQWTGSAYTERMRLDPSGNLGLGVTPSANSIAKAFELQSGFNMFGYANLGYINANAYYNGGWLYKNTAAAGRYEVGDAHKWFTAPSGTAGNGISFTQAMTLDASSRLGIKQTSPTVDLDVGANDNTVAALSVRYSTVPGYLSNSFDGTSGLTTLSVNSYNTSNGSASWSAFQNTGYGNAAVQIASNVGSADIRFLTAAAANTNPTERARITSGGYFKASNSGTYAGSTASYHELYSNASSDWIGYFTQATATSPNGVVIQYTAAAPNGAGNTFLYCQDNAAVRAEIRSNGGIANYQANDVNLSDQRLKTDIQPSGSYLDKICAIPVKTFLYKDQTDTERNLGVMAQDVDAVAPELIDHSGFGEAPEGESPYLAVYQTDLQYALMKCIQELKAQNDELRARVAALEAA